MGKQALGKSLDDLGIGDLLTNISTTTPRLKNERLINVPTTNLIPGKCQPRQEFAIEALTELAASIKAQGIVQPLVARPIPGEHGNYEIIAGERRWRASQLAGLKEVPVIVRAMDDQTAMAVALIENMLREDLNPVEQAEGLARLQQEWKLTHSQLAKNTGKSRSQITNILRLLQLEPEVKAMLSRGALNTGQARPLLALGREQQLTLAGQIEKNQYSSREVEARMVRLTTPANNTKTQDIAPELNMLEQKLRSHYSTARLTQVSGGNIKLSFTFPNDEEILKLIDLLGTTSA